MGDDTRAADILAKALDIWDEKPTDQRPRIPSGVIPTGTRRSSAPPPHTTPPRAAPPRSAPPPPPPPLPTTLASLHKRVRDAEGDIVFVIEATSKRLDLVEARQRKFVGVMDGMAARLDALETWAEQIQASLEVWGEQLATHATARVDDVEAQIKDLDDRMHTVDNRTSVRLEALSEEMQAVGASVGLDQLAGQLDLLLAQMSQWRADHEELAKKLD